jgi:hypothetical protein
MVASNWNGKAVRPFRERVLAATQDRTSVGGNSGPNECWRQLRTERVLAVTQDSVGASTVSQGSVAAVADAVT